MFAMIGNQIEMSKQFCSEIQDGGQDGGQVGYEKSLYFRLQTT